MRSFFANVWAVYRKEMGHNFVSPIAYAVGGVFLAAAGFFFYNILSIFIERSFQMGMQAMQFGGAPEMDVAGQTVRSFFGVMGQITLFVMPMLTMGLYAEERKRGTMELLMTSPIPDLHIVLGKFLGAVSLFAILLVPTLSYQLVLFLKSEPAPPWRIILTGYMGILLLGAVLVALGAFISSVTESQIIAGVLTFGVFLLLLVVDVGGRGSGTRLGETLQYVSLLRHYDDFTRGVVDTSSLVYYASLIVLGVFMTLRSLDAMRWRRA